MNDEFDEEVDKQDQDDELLDGIAITGMACRFPGANTPEQFWENLKNGVESTTFFTEEELLQAGISPSRLSNPRYVRANAILKDPEMFDAEFFGYSPRDAEVTDPQIRLFLECVWEALESAGHTPDSCEGRIGLFAGAGMSSYMLRNLLSHPDLIDKAGLFKLVISNDKDFIPLTASYKLNLKGPSVNMNTACSSSLTAVAAASQSLMLGQCDMALAGGVSIQFPQVRGYFFQEGSILSPDGRCRAFDAESNGTISGSGAGIVLLRRLEDALEARDHIYAVVRGVAINNDGSHKIGFTSPGVDGQAEVIAEAQAIAGVEPESITCIEAHGTATNLGDPIEVAALTQAFGKGCPKEFCALGSVKSNFGHLDAAAGVAGLMKMALALKYKMIPPSLHYKTPNPEIDFTNSPFYVNNHLQNWKSNGFPRRAGVSSFGIGGTNAHAVLEEFPAPETSSDSPRPSQLLTISGRSQLALETATENLLTWLRKHSDENLADVAYTLAGRRNFQHRRSLACVSSAEAVQILEKQDSKRLFSAVAGDAKRKVIFLFSGQGSQYVRMAANLYRTEPVFREILDRGAALLQTQTGFELIRTLYSEAVDQKAAQELEQTSVAQPALFIIEYALARLLINYGVEPAAMIGHSIGEYTAACIAEVFSFEDALGLVAMRGKLMQELPVGDMLSLPLPEKEVRELLSERLALAAVNGASSCVVAGDPEAIGALEEKLAARDLQGVRRLHTSHAFHSHMMEPILKPFAVRAAAIQKNKPKIPFISNLTGDWMDAKDAVDPAYWAKHIRGTVRFADGLRTVLKESRALLLEVGPGRTLSALALRHPNRTPEQAVLSCLPSAKQAEEDAVQFTATLGRLWLYGNGPDWQTYYANEVRSRLPLPTYPFDRQPYWVAEQKPAESSVQTAARKNDLSEWFYVPVWRQSVVSSVNTPPATAKTWLIFEDQHGTGAALADLLKSQGRRVVRVVPGGSFQKNAELDYTLAPDERSDYEKLFMDLSEHSLFPDCILHLWALTADEPVRDEMELTEEIRRLGFNSLLFLAQAIGAPSVTEQRANTSLEIILVVNKMEKVLEEELTIPAKALLIGPLTVIPQELPNVNCRALDIVMPETDAAHSLLLHRIFTELTLTDSLTVTGYRKGRWVRTFEQLKLTEREDLPSLLRRNGTYLITGGLGGMGLAFAELLAEKTGANLALLGRSAFPPVPDAATEQTRRRMERIELIKKKGSKVILLQADVADENAMRAAFSRVREEFGELHGVIHAAGVPSENLIQTKTGEIVEAVLAPKVRGTLTLDKLLQEFKPDFMLLCSSLSAYLGGYGSIDYCAANAFLDSFAQSREGLKGPTIVSVNWDGWKGAGMRLEAERQSGETAPDADNMGITAEEGTRALWRILNMRTPQVLVSTYDVEGLIRFWRKNFTLQKLLKQSKQGRRAGPSQRSGLFVAPRNRVEHVLADLWREYIGIEQVGIHDNFFELGGDSVVNIQIMGRARQAGVELNPKHVFERQTIAELAQLIETASDETNAGLPLTPNQRHWLEREPFALFHILELSENSQPDGIRGAVELLLQKHAVFRMSISRDLEIPVQSITENEFETYYSELVLNEESPAKRQKTVCLHAEEELKKFGIKNSPPVCFINFKSEKNSTHLFIALDRILFDRRSLNLLIEELDWCYRQVIDGASSLPKLDTTFSHWLSHFDRQTREGLFQKRAAQWLSSIGELKNTPLAVPKIKTKKDDLKTILYTTLDTAKTERLFSVLDKTYRCDPETGLLAALLHAWHLFTEKKCLQIDIETSARGIFGDDLAASRSLGNFTTVFPFVLNIGDEKSSAEILKTLKEQRRDVPDAGIAYGLSEAPFRAEIFCSFESVFSDSSETKNGSLFRSLTAEDHKIQNAVSGSYSLEIYGTIVAKRLDLCWIYRSDKYEEHQVRRLMDSFQETLHKWIEPGQDSEGAVSVSDFPDATLDEDVLQKLSARFKNIG